MEIFLRNRDDFKETLAFKTEFPVCISNTNFTLTKFKFYNTNISKNFLTSMFETITGE
jgi:hypothetical protein